MKTINEIKEQIEITTGNHDTMTVDAFKGNVKKFNNAKKSLVEEVVFLRQCQMYLEREPSEEFIRKELDRMNAKRQLVEDGFAAWLTANALNYSKDPSEYKPQYNKLMGTSDINKQLKTLNYLLS